VGDVGEAEKPEDAIADGTIGETGWSEGGVAVAAVRLPVSLRVGDGETGWSEGALLATIGELVA
jgi:hypothetical protein